MRFIGFYLKAQYGERERPPASVMGELREIQVAHAPRTVLIYFFAAFFK
jgi:hypothetical protein